MEDIDRQIKGLTAMVMEFSDEPLDGPLGDELFNTENVRSRKFNACHER